MILIVLLLAVILLLTALINRLFIAPPVESSSEVEKGGRTIIKAIQIEILNATDSSGLAATAKKYMDDRGFDIVEIGNFKNKIDKTFIVDRMGDRETAEKVAYAFGLPDSLISSKIDSSLSLSASVIIGKDFYKYKPFQ